MSATWKTRYTVKVEALQEAEDCDLFGVYTDVHQAGKVRDILAKKLTGTGYFVHIQKIHPQRTGKSILEKLKIDGWLEEVRSARAANRTANDW